MIPFPASLYYTKDYFKLVKMKINVGSFPFKKLTSTFLIRSKQFELELRIQLQRAASLYTVQELFTYSTGRLSPFCLLT